MSLSAFIAGTFSLFRQSALSPAQEMACMNYMPWDRFSTLWTGSTVVVSGDGFNPRSSLVCSWTSTYFPWWKILYYDDRFKDKIQILSSKFRIKLTWGFSGVFFFASGCFDLSVLVSFGSGWKPISFEMNVSSKTVGWTKKTEARNLGTVLQSHMQTLQNKTDVDLHRFQLGCW